MAAIFFGVDGTSFAHKIGNTAYTFAHFFGIFILDVAKNTYLCISKQRWRIFRFMQWKGI